MQQAVLTRFPSFDDPKDTTPGAAKKSDVGKWSHQQLEFLFDSSLSNSVLPMLELLPLYTKEGTDKPSEFRKCFATDDKNPGYLRIVCATLEKTVSFATLGPGAETLRRVWNWGQFERDLLICHHVFTNSLSLMKLLREAYHRKQPQNIDENECDMKPASTVLTILTDWILMEYGSDFIMDDELVAEFEDFLNKDIIKDLPTEGTELQQLLHTAMQLSPPYPLNSAAQIPKSILPKKLAEPLQLVTLNPLELARQMTLVDELFLHKIAAKEFLGGAWTKKDAIVRAPNLTKFIHHANRMTNLVVMEILSMKTKDAIREYLEFWISVGDHLRTLHNYSGLMNILSALHNASIGRLTNAWGDLKKQDKDLFDSLTDSVSLLGHYKNYREKLKSIDSATPVIPLIAVTCSDLNGLGEVLENTTADGWINWDKHSKVAELIWSVKRFMRARYVLSPVPAIQNYLETAVVWEGEKTMAAIAKFRNKFCNAEISKTLTPTILGRSKVERDPNELIMLDKDWDKLKSKDYPIITKYGKGEAILDEGDTSRWLFRLKKGNVTNVVFGTMKDKGMFGELSLLLKTGECETISAKGQVTAQSDPTEIYKYDCSWVKQQCKDKENSQLAEKLNRIVANSLADRLKNWGKGHQVAVLQVTQDDELSSAMKPSESKLKGLTSKGTLTTGRKEKRGFKRSASSKFDLTESPTPAIKEKSSVADFKYNSSSIFNSIFQTNEVVQSAYSCAHKVGEASAEGTLYLTKEHVSFYATNFGRIVKTPLIHFTQIKKCECDDEKKILTLLYEGKPLKFKEFSGKGPLEPHKIISDAMEALGGQSGTDKKEEVVPTCQITVTEDPNSLLPDNEDWEHILSGTRSQTFKRGQTVIREEQSCHQRIFQVAQGGCQVEKLTPEGVTVVLARLSPGSIFGEISFLEGMGAKATATVTATKNDTVIQIIEGYFLETLFEYYPGLSGRFYHYLANILLERLRQRGRESPSPLLKSESESEDDELASPRTSSGNRLPAKSSKTDSDKKLDRKPPSIKDKKRKHPIN